MTAGHLALPRRGSGPPILVLCDAGDGAPAAPARAYCDRLAEDDYRVLGVSAPGTLAALVPVLEDFAGDHPVVAIALDAGIPLALELARSARLDGLILFGTPAAVRQGELGDLAIPVVCHLAGPVPAEDLQRRRATNVRVFSYPGQRSGFAQPGHAAFDRMPASIAGSRSLALLRRLLGPQYDLAGLFAEHLRQEFECRDADATMGTMVDTPYVNHIATMTGGVGHDMLKRFYKYHFIPCLPPDRVNLLVSEVVGADTVVLEGINCFTHDRVIDHILPGVAPTGRRVELPFVAIAKFKGDRLYYEHIYWDQASLLVQIGLLDPKGLPVAGAEQPAKVRDITRPSNTLMPNWAQSEGKPL